MTDVDIDLGDPVARAAAEESTGLGVPVAIGLGEPVGVQLSLDQAGAIAATVSTG